MTIRPNLRQIARLFLILALLSMALTACLGDDSSDATPTVPGVAGGTPGATPTPKALELPTPTPVGPPPSPAAINTSSLTMIDEWQAAQIPLYPGAERADYQPNNQTAVRNGGQMLYRTIDPPQEVLAFYRAALPFLGWTEKQANAQFIYMERDEMSILVSTTPDQGETNVLMMLQDA